MPIIGIPLPVLSDVLTARKGLATRFAARSATSTTMSGVKTGLLVARKGTVRVSKHVNVANKRSSETKKGLSVARRPLFDAITCPSVARKPFFASANPLLSTDRGLLTLRRPLLSTDKGLLALRTPLLTTDRGLLTLRRPMSKQDSGLLMWRRPLSKQDRGLLTQGRPLSAASEGLLAWDRRRFAATKPPFAPSGRLVTPYFPFPAGSASRCSRIGKLTVAVPLLGGYFHFLSCFSRQAFAGSSVPSIFTDSAFPCGETRMVAFPA